MFGDEPVKVRICCGPRCGVCPEHRAVYDAAEAVCATGEGVAAPTLCRGRCGDGVTLVREDGTTIKARSASEARARLQGGV